MGLCKSTHRRCEHRRWRPSPGPFCPRIPFKRPGSLPDHRPLNACSRSRHRSHSLRSGEEIRIIAKQNNSLTELQALEGIYEHLSTIDDLAKEVGMISTRLRKIEERLKEPMEIADPILNPGHSREYSRDTCIYGALIKSIDACIGLTEQRNVLNDIISDVRHVKSALEIIKKDQAKQNKASEDLMTAIKENA